LVYYHVVTRRWERGPTPNVSSDPTGPGSLTGDSGARAASELIVMPDATTAVDGAGNFDPAAGAPFGLFVFVVDDKADRFRATTGPSASRWRQSQRATARRHADRQCTSMALPPSRTCPERNRAPAHIHRHRKGIPAGLRRLRCRPDQVVLTRHRGQRRPGGSFAWSPRWKTRRPDGQPISTAT